MLKDTFCSSPWFHIRITPTGHYDPCRWGQSDFGNRYHISTTSLLEYLNSDTMNQLRLDFLNGKQSILCQPCYYESKHNKVSGKQRQLLKSAIVESNFEKTFCASPHYKHFAYSYQNQGLSNLQPVDLQIDLGNVCNSSCIMCSPRYSSRLEQEHKKLHNIIPELIPDPQKIHNWTDDPILVDKFINDIEKSSEIKYLHFLGGETLYLKSFYDICNRLIDLGLAKNIIMGTTTNCTVYDDRIEHIIKNFKQVHLGLSIESIGTLNDYLRWPSKIPNVLQTVEKFLAVRDTSNLQISLRITPNIFSIWHIDSLFEYMIENHIIAESCNILSDPKCLRIELLPQTLRANVSNRLDQLINKYNLIRADEIIINRRREDLIDPVISEIIFEYKDFIDLFQEPDDSNKHRYDLVDYIKAFESIHHNNILNYLPEYEEFLRSYGY